MSLDLKASSYISRLVLQGQYDCRAEIDSYAQAAADRGVSTAAISTTVIEVCQAGFTRAAKADIIQLQIKASLEELPVETHHA